MRPITARAALLLCAVAAWAAPATAHDWSALFDAAWAGREAAAAARLAPADAARATASGWLPDAPTVVWASRGDRADPRRGMREWEVELAAPLWWPGQRERARAVAEAEHALQRAVQVRERWQLAGELREAAWALRLDQADAEAAAARRAQAERLAEDIERRVRAGDLAPLDLNQAQSVLAAAGADAVRASAALERARQRLRALAPGAALPAGPEALASAQAEEAHPLLAEWALRVERARTRLAQAGHDTRDAPELSLAVTREREDPAQAWQQRARLALRVPLGAHTASAERQAAAAAELAEARQALEQGRRQLAADRAAAEADLAAARRVEASLAERATLAQQALGWVDQAFKAGQLGAPALLRAAAEQADAQRQAERARLEAGRAVSRHNHTLGSMP